MSNARNIGDSAPVINFLDNVTSDVQTQLNTLDTAIGNVSVTSGSLTKTFAADETATVTLTGNVLAPVVTATKEVAQTGVTNNDWDAAAGSYTLENSATATTIDFGAYNLSSAVFSYRFDVSAQAGTPTSLAFNPTGTFMYVLDDTGNDINMYTIVTAFDVSTAQNYNNFSVASQETTPTGFAFNNDGTKMYVCGTQSQAVNEYTCSTPYYVTTATYVQNFSVASQAATPWGVAFNLDGTKMFVLGNGTDAVYEYALSTGFDVSSASYTDSFSVGTESTYPLGLDFNPDGTKMYISDNGAAGINEYSLSTAFDVSTASFSQLFSTSALEQYPAGLAFNADGSKMFWLGYTAKDVFEYDIPLALTKGTGTWSSSDVGKTVNLNGGSVVLTATSGAYTVTSALSSTNQVASGNWTMFGALYDSTADVLKPSGVAGAGYDISAASYTGDTLSANILHGVRFNNDGTKMFTLQGNNGGGIGNVNEYTLTTPYLPSSGTYVTGFSVYSQDTYVRDIFFNSDGTKMWMIGNGTDSIYLYNLTTGFNISTASYASVSASIASTGNQPTGMEFSPDGTRIYISNAQFGNVYEYPVSPAFDITGIGSYAGDVSTGTGVTGIAISSDGTKFFNTNGSGGVVDAWSLSTPFSLSSATHISGFSISAQAGTDASGLAFNADGSRMVVCSSVQGIWQYNMQSVTTATGYQPAISSTIDSTYWVDINSMTATNAVGDGNVFYALSADSKTSWNILSNGTGATFVVTVAGGKFVIDGVSQDSLTLQEGQTYIFNQADASNGSHPLRLSTTADGTHGGGTEYTTGVTTSGTPGNSGAYTQIVVAAGAPTLYYYCSAHSGMGGTITIGVTGVRKIVKNNSGTYQVNTNSTYGSETWANAAVNSEVAALREAMTSAIAVSGQYDVSTATLVDYFSIISQDNAPYGFCFSATGHKLYFSGTQQKAIFECSLTTNFDVSTASYTANYGVIAQETMPADVQFNSDGTKMFVLGDTGNDVGEYALSTAWSVVSATFTHAFSIATYETSPWGLTFNADGTKMFTIGIGGNVVEWALSTGFDVSTASYTQYFGTSGQLTYATGVEFNSDGTKMFVIDNGGQDVLTYTLTTGFDVSTASFTSRFDVNRGGLAKVRFNTDGTKMFLGNYSYADVGEYTVGTTDYVNQMTSTELAAINDASQITLGSALDFATILYYASGSTTPTYSGTAINYDANVINQGAILGTDYTYDAPAQNKVRITSVNAANLKIRVV
jgi:6-phosphogluconolactonase (cycloisomerase 2 family)